jgi:predicted ATPase
MPRRIVLTGGPGGGKTTFLARATGLLCPVFVTTVEETAGSEKRAGDRSAAVDFQRRVLVRHLRAEDDGLRRAKQRENSIVLFDRGIFDAIGFMGEARYERLLREFDLSPSDVLRRYDGVVFLRSGVPAGYTAEARFRTPTASAFIEHTRDVERLLFAALAHHPAVVIVEPESDVELKLEKVAAACRSVAGI